MEKEDPVADPNVEDDQDQDGGQAGSCQRMELYGEIRSHRVNLAGAKCLGSFAKKILHTKQNILLQFAFQYCLFLGREKGFWWPCELRVESRLKCGVAQKEFF